MASDRDRCGGLGSFLAMSCRGRAEAFARRLHSKLKSLGSQDDNGSADESSWLAANETPITLSQPAHSSNPEQFLDLELLESPGSPEVELEVDLGVLNKDTLRASLSKNNQQFNKQIPRTNTSNYSNSNDSDSDGPFYDTDDQRLLNHTNGVAADVSISETTINNSQDSTSECTSQQMLSISEDVSLLSFKEEEEDEEKEEESSLEIDSSSCNGDVSEKGSVKIVISDDLSDNKDFVSETKTDEEHEEEEEEEQEEQPLRVRRSTSLKSGKTPPGTPGQKKFVRFADALGLDLADVRTFLDEIPKVPTSAYEDLDDVDFGEFTSNAVLANIIERSKPAAQKYLLPMFQQPASLPNFLDLVREYNVCLENAFVDDPILLSLKGTVRVRNLDFHKSVHIRYTLDSWATFADVKATYVDNSCDGFSDKFTFLLYAHTLSIGQKLEMACRFQCRGCQYWDNNRGSNYCFQCLPASHNNSMASTASHHLHDEWSSGASFY